MSQQHDSSKGTTIKIAAKEASQRNSDGADPGPGDPSAAPSEAPQLVDIPDPPTSEQLVVKSTASKQATNLPTLNEARSGTGPSGRASKSTMHTSMSGAGGSKLSGSKAGPAASNPSAIGSAREPTSSRPLTGVPESEAGSAAMKSSVSASHKSSTKGAKSTTGSPMSGTGGAGPTSISGLGKSTTGGAGKSTSGASKSSTVGAKSTTGAMSKSALGGPKSASPITASTAMQADSGVVHDEDEEGEGELEHPDEGSPTSSAAASPSAATAGRSSAGAKSSAGHSKSATTGGISGGASGGPSAGPSGFGPSGTSASSAKDKKNKVTKFRYHKRIVVRTKGNANPSSIMDKVNKKAGNTRITPSTIEDMDPQELMKRAGIKGTNKTHWRVRLRQTKRLTKNGKTTTQTKVAYRDSEGNKRVKTSLSPFCKNCNKKLEDCKCESSSQS